MTDAELEEAKRIARGCQCTHEQGDSDCAQHPRCNNCDEDQAGTYLARKAALVPRLIAALESARRERDEAVVQQRHAWERHAEKDRAYGEALAERDTARAEAERLESGWDAASNALVDLGMRIHSLADEHAGPRPIDATPDSDVEALENRIGELLTEAEQLRAERDAAVRDLDGAKAWRQQLRDAVVRETAEAAANWLDEKAAEWDASKLPGNDAAMIRLCAKDVRNTNWRTTKGDAGK